MTTSYSLCHCAFVLKGFSVRGQRRRNLTQSHRGTESTERLKDLESFSALCLRASVLKGRPARGPRRRNLTQSHRGTEGTERLKDVEGFSTLW